MEEVDHLVKKYETADPFKLAKYLGIIVLYEPLGSIFGYYNRQRRIKLIHINIDLPYFKQRFVCAHELGHAIFHVNVNTAFLKAHTFYSIDRIEMQANRFATQLLICGVEIPIEICKKDFLLSQGIPAQMEAFI